MNSNFTDIIDQIDKKIDNLKSQSEYIKSKFNQNNFIITENKLKLILDLVKYINVLTDKFDDVKNIVLETTNLNNLSVNEKEVLRNNKINNIVSQKFMPYMIYATLCLQSTENL
jgi:hypothetical protein